MEQQNKSRRIREIIIYEVMSNEELMELYEEASERLYLVREEVKRRRLFKDQPEPWTGHTE